ncbi:MAG: hypothetical protein PUC47_05605 [Oscillospiraceae bacterium]|nr:hypothetical protein [Oscillospiraceae bacterium]
MSNYSHALDAHSRFWKDPNRRNPGCCRNFYRKLWQGILQDYEEFGRCEYIERLLSRSIVSITRVEFSILTGMAKEEPFLDPDSLDRIPHIIYRDGWGQRDVFWEEGSLVQAVKETDLQNAGIIRTRLRAQAAIRDSRIDIPIGGDTPSAQVPPVQKKEELQTQQMIRQAEAQAQQLLTEARQEAERIRAEAEAERARLNADHAALLAEARQEADRIRSEAEAERVQLNADRAALLAQADSQARQQARNLITQHLADYQRQMRLQWDRDTAEAEQQDTRATQEIDSARKEMCGTVNDLKVSWRTDLEKAIEEMRGLQTQLETRLRDWQRALYPREFEPLADCYVQLYRIVNQDRLLADALTAEQGGGSNYQLLEQLSRSLSVFLRKFAKAMGRLGLQVYVPAVGEPYDDVLQAPDGDEPDDAFDRTVAECLVPGVVYQLEGKQEEGDPIIRAVVRLAPGSGEE